MQCQFVQSSFLNSIYKVKSTLPINTNCENESKINLMSTNLVFYHSFLSTRRFVTSGKPHYMHKAMGTAHPPNTRQAAGGQLHLGGNFDSKQGLLHDGFK